ncbi:hemolysin III family protein [Aureisphaera galaxeae]|uniref:PAQR family membrane homeostasis protein TrhA n=1 Tax=Aureisphaera galaxeae TaxID=1538023 RepID=UPI00234FF01D|nr:hemolysin III family protein [Aureisphaera galaxeae]MDC8004415.1 hemolysin III family protein [Aureisphaera galaxeae]
MYTKREEFWNTLTHGLGVLLAITGLVVLLVKDTHESTYSTLSILFYGISLILLYLASTLYHAIPWKHWKSTLRKLDHISIYLLIAGTYTPVALISLIDGNGWTIFWTVWIIAGIGTLLKVFFTGKFEAISLLLYLVMGWLILFDFTNVVEAHSTFGLTLLALGGAAYTLGIVFYVVEKIPYNHAIWHLFVLAGSIFHFFFILYDVI